MDPNCEDRHCQENTHYNKKLLENYQKSTDFSQFDHSEDIDYSKDVDVKICSCDDCSDDEHSHNHEHHHNHNQEHSHGESCSCEEDHEHHHNHTHSHEHSHEDNCGCGDNHEHHHDHDHNHEHSHGDSCSCGCEDDDVNISICNCDDCADEDGEEEPVIAEGKPLLANRSIQIIVSSGILFVLGHILEYFGVMNGLAATIVFMVGAVIAGYQIAIMGWNAITKRHTISPAVLMTIACIASFLINCPEEGAAVTFLYYIAEFLEDYSELRAQKSIKSLVEIAPETARVKVGESEELRKVDDVNIGEIVIVKPGDKVPLDGKVISGVSSINQASITGESLPVTKNIGDKVFSGTVNQEGYLEVEVTKESKDSVISKIVSLVKHSQLNRSNTETLVEKIAKYYTPIIIVITICVASIPPLVFGEDLVSWVYRALSIMVISCPCAFLISTPIGMVSSITSATKQGVIIKGSTHVEEMRNIKAVIFDKTGTLTEGKLALSDIDVLDNNYSEEELVEIAASLESKSSHPIGQAIVNYANENNIYFTDITDFKNVPGKGIIGKFNNEDYYAANESLIEGSSFDVDRSILEKYAQDGKTVIYVGNKDNVIGIITVKDKLRDEAKEVISSLNNMGVQTVMLTGDNKIAAKSVADKLGIKYVYSELMPEDKLNILDTIRNKFGDTAMVGDGINDAPALARSNVGIAMGAVGSDVAIETADIALMQDDLTKLPYLFSLSHKTMNIIKQNIIAAISVKVLFVFLAILGLITLMMSVGIGDLGLTLLVIFNSFRIGFVKNPIV
ncbi:MAG: cation-translocating P-type ATPase [Methanosphaera stadtmanae]|nr:cation-translocating P-type ATPase [Methanosphaera stadtmanae]